MSLKCLAGEREHSPRRLSAERAAPHMNGLDDVEVDDLLVRVVGESFDCQVELRGEVAEPSEFMLGTPRGITSCLAYLNNPSICSRLPSPLSTVQSGCWRPASGAKYWRMVCRCSETLLAAVALLTTSTISSRGFCIVVVVVVAGQSSGCLTQINIAARLQ